MRRSVLLPLVGLAILAGCGAKKVCTPSGQSTAALPPPDWREAITDADHGKLRGLRTVFQTGLTQARAAGFAAKVAGTDRLYDPDYALDGIKLDPGAYTCRSITLGTKVTARPAFVESPAYGCTIEAAGALQRYTQNDGPQRLVGRIYPDESARSVFLGTTVLTDEATALHYSRDPDRDVVGSIQRIGDRRWRMTIPSPAWEAPLMLIELTPAK